MNKALVMFSGGQDSCTLLAWALSRFDKVETVVFRYGQRHDIELYQREEFMRALRDNYPLFADRLGEDHFVDVAGLSKFNRKAMTDDVKFARTAENLPNTFLPGRNLIFMMYAGAICYSRDIDTIVGGMSETASVQFTGAPGYPDCRNNTIQATEEALRHGLARPNLTIETPLMWIDKAAVWRMAWEHGGDPLVELIVEHSHTCFKGDRSTRYVWGYGCNECPACKLRAHGWYRWKGEA